jgi:hypothetical protein
MTVDDIVSPFQAGTRLTPETRCASTGGADALLGRLADDVRRAHIRRAL